MSRESIRSGGRTGIVLCGGRSSRMGRAKAWLPWFGSSMIEHVVDCLLPVVDEVVVVTSAELDLPPLSAQVVSDRAPECGPLAGIREGLAAAKSEYAFVTSVDAPHLSRDFVDTMFGLGMAAAPVSEGRVQVLSAIYPCDAWKRADDLLSQNIRRPLTLLEELGYKPIEWPLQDGSLAASAPASWLGFNTPTEYLDAVRSRDPEATAEVELLGRASRKADVSRQRVPVGTLGEVLLQLPESLRLVEDGRVAKPHLVSLGGRDLVRDLTVPVGPGENVSVIDALAGG
jgi:molybdopterin-guanine dinucleotide biosynthesis protein A